jgi:hypothetical protein
VEPVVPPVVVPPEVVPVVVPVPPVVVPVVVPVPPLVVPDPDVPVVVPEPVLPEVLPEPPLVAPVVDPVDPEPPPVEAIGPKLLFPDWVPPQPAMIRVVINDRTVISQHRAAFSFAKMKFLSVKGQDYGWIYSGCIRRGT